MGRQQSAATGTLQRVYLLAVTWFGKKVKLVGGAMQLLSCTWVMVSSLHMTGVMNHMIGGKNCPMPQLMRQHMIEMTTEEITKYANMYNDVLKDTILDWLLSRRVT